jgi:hypothetical protein
LVVSGNYGLDGFNNTADLSKYIVAVDVFANTDETVKCYHAGGRQRPVSELQSKKMELPFTLISAAWQTHRVQRA